MKVRLPGFLIKEVIITVFVSLSLRHLGFFLVSPISTVVLLTQPLIDGLIRIPVFYPRIIALCLIGVWLESTLCLHAVTINLLLSLLSSPRVLI